MTDVMTIDGGTENYAKYASARSTFDANSDGRVTRTEFLEQMTKQTCCGTNAPFRCWCESYAYRVFPPVDSAYRDRFEVATDTFMANLIEQNLTRLLPSCRQGVTASGAGFAASGPPKRLSVRANKGEVVVSLKQAPSAAAAGPYSASTHMPEDKPQPGLQMLHSDAQRLMSTYGAKIGDLDGSVEDMYLVIDASVPATGETHRWLYSTNPVYLLLPLPILGILSFGGLHPPMAYEQVRLLRPDCNVQRSLDAATSNATLSDMNYQLTRALKSNGADKTSPLRGILVHQTLTEVGWGLGRLEYFPRLRSAYGDVAGYGVSRDRVEWSADSTWSRLVAALVVSAVFGLGTALFQYAFLMARVGRVRRDIQRRREANKVMTLLRHYPHLTIKTLRARVRAQQEEDNPIVWTEFEEPFVLLRMALIAPLERKFVNSVDRFAEERLERTDGVPMRGVAAALRQLKKQADALSSSLAPEALRPAPAKAASSATATSTVSFAPAAANAPPAAAAGGALHDRSVPVSVPALGAGVDRDLEGNADQSQREQEAAPAAREMTMRRTLYKQEFVYLRTIFREYELYCLEYDLMINPKRDFIQRRLVFKYGAKVSQVVVTRLNGIRQSQSRNSSQCRPCSVHD